MNLDIMVEVKIKENSWIARIAAYKLKSSSIAMVIGKTIHLHNSTKKDFLANEVWVRHEIEHVNQYMRLGLLGFLGRYLLESLRKGYVNNRFEVEARRKENDLSLLSEVFFI